MTFTRAPPRSSNACPRGQALQRRSTSARGSTLDRTELDVVREEEIVHTPAVRSVDSEPVRVRFCELIAVGNSVTAKKILSIEDVPPDRLPPAEELSRRLGPNEGVLVGDTLYASGRAVDPFDRSAGRLGSTSEPTDPALADSELDRQFE